MKKKDTLYQLLFTALALYLIFLMLRYPALALEYASKGLHLWFTKMVPTLLLYDSLGDHDPYEPDRKLRTSAPSAPAPAVRDFKKRFLHDRHGLFVRLPNGCADRGRTLRTS